MSQLVLTSIGEADEVDHDPNLTLGPGDLLVSMEAATINLTDFRLAAGTYTERVTPALPMVMGTEGVGRVVQAGSTADRDSHRA